MESIWEKDSQRLSFESLYGNKDTDVLIIGGGITGILCAYFLKNRGIDCILVEADRICRGISGNTTAKITFCHGLLYHKLIKKSGLEAASEYLEAQKTALAEFRRLCQNTDCNYEEKSSFVYSLDDRKKIEKEIEALNSLGVDARFSETLKLPFETVGAVRVDNQAQFNPLKFIFSIAKSLPIYENTRVTQFLPYKAVTSDGEITFRKLIVATHFPIFNKHGLYPLKMYQHRSYVIALEGAQDVDGMYVDEYEKGLSFRNYNGLLLLGGGDHRTGKKGGCWRELEEFSDEYYKNAKIVARWAAQDCMTLDTIPYIGQYSKSTPDVYVATGFNKWGMTSSMVSAMILSDMTEGKRNIYEDVFCPSRSIFQPQLALNILESVAGLITPTAPRCPHLGCALKYNPDEHTWDCPCHGSRFSEDGKLIDNPSTDDKKM